jgi:hypothetical protein
VALRPRYYAAVRANTLAFDTATATHAAIRAAFRRLAALYPEAVFPDVYFVIGRLESGGTTSDRGLLIGLEMYAATADTPRDELLPWQRVAVHRLDDVPALVAHELAHFQQVPERGTPTLLARALREGGADFVAELIAGRHANQQQRAYGDAHEAALWAEFAPAMHGTDVSRWLYGSSGSGDRPPDMGYDMGYRLARAFYARAADKAEALRAILRAEDPDRILRESGFVPSARTPSPS